MVSYVDGLRAEWGYVEFFLDIYVDASFGTYYTDLGGDMPGNSEICFSGFRLFCAF